VDAWTVASHADQEYSREFANYDCHKDARCRSPVEATNEVESTRYSKPGSAWVHRNLGKQTMVFENIDRQKGYSESRRIFQGPDVCRQLPDNGMGRNLVIRLEKTGIWEPSELTVFW
jgi:hypothetical protein